VLVRLLLAGEGCIVAHQLGSIRLAFDTSFSSLSLSLTDPPYYILFFLLAHNKRSLFHLWSMTKAWSALMIGILEREGRISINETLGDIWTDPDVWAEAEQSDDRQNITIEHVLQMRAGLTMPEYVVVSRQQHFCLFLFFVCCLFVLHNNYLVASKHRFCFDIDSYRTFLWQPLPTRHTR